MAKIFDVARNHDEQFVYRVNHKSTTVFFGRWVCVCACGFMVEGGYIEFA